ncbi:polyketide cyclase [Burkholderia cenocepacia]|jgi:predicted SnoaL-like aldol condensation-catalyzing enzyme|uniref:nuclear transport factor 2 family protein n=1 Tax=Burkholderia TaxID=32008 RepID=UPI000B7AC1AA|nr:MULTISPECIES: nuclear transport factor 2 family protein [Burkholderia]MDN7431561.1 nuclear transport factor 2 family protein [Burkholderia sp. AU45388]OXI28229.1 polyketide cyclase [Burkholderia sp. AU16741]RQU98216.1 polyketide cyclase [Burkholderia cenocepacia]
MSTDSQLEQNKAIVRDFFQKVFVEHEVDAGLLNFRPDYIQHNPMVPTGLEAVRAAFKQGIQNVSTEIKRIIAEGDLVVVHHHFKFDPASLGAAVIDIFRIENGKIAEHWDVMTPVPEKPNNNNSMF